MPPKDKVVADLNKRSALAQHGATVVMACRNLAKAEHAAEKIRALHPTGELVILHLNLADLNLVRNFAATVKARFDRLDLLVNNVGIMIPPFGMTEQGFESQFGVNHLGHFALTAQVSALLTRTPAARVVIVSSTAHRFGEIDFGDLNWKHKDYNAMGAYGQSKLANLLFTYELQRRLAVAGHDTLAVAAHPGYAATNLQGDGAMMALVNRLVAQPQAMGALPPLYRPRPAPCKVDSTSDPPALPRSRATLSGSDPVSGRIIMRTRGACGRSRKR